MKNIRVDSTTDSDIDQRVAETQPYNIVELVITTGNQSARLEDGSTEHVEPATENVQGLIPGRELRQNMVAYSKKVEAYKKDFPDFEQLVGQDIPLPLAVRDEILRLHNGPAIAHFLGFSPEVAEQLCAMHPLDAIECVKNISADLDSGSLPGDESDYGVWKNIRNGPAGSKRRGKDGNNAIRRSVGRREATP